MESTATVCFGEPAGLRRHGVPQRQPSLWAIIVIFPMVWLVYSSFKTDQEIFFAPWSFPATPQWNNFVRAWENVHIGQYLINSMIVVVPSLVLTPGALGDGSLYPGPFFAFRAIA